MFKIWAGSVKKAAVGLGGAISGGLLSASVALADSTDNEITVPEIDTGILTDAGTAVFAAVALAVAIGIGLRLFKRG